MSPRTLPMFPLGIAYLPGDPVVLRVFEDRYVAMVRDLLAGDELEMGSVLITGGSEVGGGDRRADRGVHVRITDCLVTAEGGYAIAGVAAAALRVIRWHEDDPYPRAEVELVAAEPGGASDLSAECIESTRRLALDVGEMAARGTIELSRAWSSPATVGESLASIGRPGVLDAASIDAAQWLIARSVPCGQADRLELLRAPRPTERLAELRRIVDHVREVAEFQRLGGGAGRDE